MNIMTYVYYAPNGVSLRVVGLPQSIGTVQIVSTLSCLSGGLGPQFFWKPVMRPRNMAGGAPAPCVRHESNPGPKPTLKTLLDTLTQSPTLTQYTNSPVQLSQSFPPSLSPAHSPTYVQSPLHPLQNTTTYHRAFIQLHTLIYLKQHTGPLDVSREGGASASQVERTPGRATLAYWVVGPLHSDTLEGWVNNNNICIIDVFINISHHHYCKLIKTNTLYLVLRWRKDFYILFVFHIFWFHDFNSAYTHIFLLHYFTFNFH